MISVVFPRQAKPVPVEFDAVWMGPLGKKRALRWQEFGPGWKGRETREKMRGEKRRKGGRRR